MASENEKRSRIAATNKPSLTDDVTLMLRSITEKRAATMTRMLDEAKAHGLDDKFAIKAVHDYGVDNGQDFKESMVDPHDMKEFADKFTDNLEANVYEMETVKSTEDDFRVHFHYCPYVNRWLRMGKTTDEMANLCDICMKGDRAVAANFDDIDFDLGSTIAKGNPYCEVRYFKTRKTKE
ncbi:hypothetical protein G8J22_00674 [Lentilactobacillus hilgardii]|uniref:L-2-amino-thiazoline-4-carboxylic acid hydrolase n=1 Tax=Lentilactobacillus hilgardii TaxID=1588 RepID=UPI00019C4D78|nr:L-2-amino-thiazoline-4-carboxylic acid hydrolase [Lentilactobacillus hilgardii]EEI20256.1 hypothetical protein HMPREF0497_0976 [Lentilactobacillus buchneri ATCC 11577]MCT3396869.1 hypothetical protein [Lentilactobacillus hilgardii]QIR08740.1 hypothetical protein G8J22_00674 [Lentilactobacillus hilgardii]